MSLVKEDFREPIDNHEYADLNSENPFKVESFPSFMVFFCKCGRRSLRQGRCRKCGTPFTNRGVNPVRHNQGSWWDKIRGRKKNGK